MLWNVTPQAGLPTASNIIRNLLTKNGPLHSLQIYALGLQQYPSASTSLPHDPPPLITYGKDGKVKYKVVFNKRGGKRPWQPPPEAAYPDHPFMSMNHLKRNILHELENQNLIRKVRVEVPITDLGSPEARQAIHNARKITRRRQRHLAEEIGLGTAYRKHGEEYKLWEKKVYALDVEVEQPKLTKSEFVWELVGGNVTEGKGKERESETSLISLEDFDSMSKPGSTHSSILDNPLVKARWAVAEGKEAASRQFMQMARDEAQLRKASRARMHLAKKERMMREPPRDRYAEAQARQMEQEMTARERFAQLRPRQSSETESHP